MDPFQCKELLWQWVTLSFVVVCVVCMRVAHGIGKSENEGPHPMCSIRYIKSICHTPFWMRVWGVSQVWARMDIILSVLKSGHHILVTDLDILYFQVIPFPIFPLCYHHDWVTCYFLLEWPEMSPHDSIAIHDSIITFLLSLQWSFWHLTLTCAESIHLLSQGWRLGHRICNRLV